MKKIKYFTLLELIIVLIVLGILITLAIPTYSNMVERAKAKVCETNVNVLHTALEAYALENDKLPGSLGQLRSKDLEYAWNKERKRAGIWTIKLAYFIVDLDSKGAAYAQGVWLGRYVNDVRNFVCPLDTTPPPGGISYGLNQNLANISLAAYKSLLPNTIVIMDADAVTFDPGNYATIALRHQKYQIWGAVSPYAVGTRTGKVIVYLMGYERGGSPYLFDVANYPN